ncbi:MAG: diguanylate cyclase domain-containing protein [Clostridia bacterium]
MDLDYFKNINDTLGHDIGDTLLQQAAKRLVKVLDNNEVLARMGGDEFTILIPQITGVEQSCMLAHKAMEELACVYEIDEHELYITASIGIAIYPDDGSESAVIMKHADTALYNAKENGRNAYRSYAFLDDEKLITRFELTKDLHTAILRNEMGVSISTNDFGTGYSSLNYLRYLPIHILKIDKSFIRDMENDQNTKVIVKSIIDIAQDIAHSLKLKVTAEGVETLEQLSMLKHMSSDEIQGFLISKPLPLLELQKNILPIMA